MPNTLSLYLDTSPQRPPTFEGLGNIIKSFDSLITEVGFVINPSDRIELRVQDLERGSIKLDALVDTIRSGGMDAKTYYTILATVLLYFGVTVSNVVIEEEIKKKIYGDEVKISQEQIEEIKEASRGYYNKSVGRNTAIDFLTSIDKEAGVVGVGVSIDTTQKPRALIDKTHIRNQITLLKGFDSQSEELESRDYEYEKTLLIISPILSEEDRRWKFKSGNSEFGAIVRDKEFVRSLLSGNLSVRMAAGVYIRATVKIKEVKIDGSWSNQSHEVIKVHGIEYAAEQSPLDFDNLDDAK